MFFVFVDDVVVVVVVAVVVDGVFCSWRESSVTPRILAEKHKIE